MERVIEIAVQADAPIRALEGLATRVVSELSGSGSQHLEHDRSTRISAESVDPAGLVADLVDALCAARDDFGATPVTVSIEGFRELPVGYRVWGVVGLSYGNMVANSSVHRLGPVTVTHVGDTWQMSVHIAIT